MNLGSPLKAQGSLVDQIVHRITDAVMNGELKPGDQIPTENQLTETFQVGKSSIRESIKVLQTLGVVDVRRGEGTFVSTGNSDQVFNPVLYSMMLEPYSLDKLVELRMVFEPAYSVLAMENATLEDLEEIEHEKNRFEDLAENGTQTGSDDIRFHMSILHATHNNYIIKIGEMILRLLLETVGKGTKLSPLQSIQDHERIYQALKSGDTEKLHEAVMQSFEGWKRIDS